MRDRIENIEKELKLLDGRLQQKADNSDILQFNDVFVKKGTVRDIENYIIQLSDYLAQLS